MPYRQCQIAAAALHKLVENAAVDEQGTFTLQRGRGHHRCGGDEVEALDAGFVLGRQQHAHTHLVGGEIRQALG